MFSSGPVISLGFNWAAVLTRGGCWQVNPRLPVSGRGGSSAPEVMADSSRASGQGLASPAEADSHEVPPRPRCGCRGSDQDRGAVSTVSQWVRGLGSTMSSTSSLLGPRQAPVGWGICVCRPQLEPSSSAGWSQACRALPSESPARPL